MNVFKKMYRDFFGLNEITISVPKNDPTAFDIAKKQAEKDKTGKTQIKLEDADSKKTKTTKRWQDNDGDGKWYEKEDLVDEAQLLNKITDYRGGVEFVLFDPATAENVFNEIKQFAAKKKIYVIKSKLSPSGKVGYFQFRLGEDPAKESQQIQGYISQKPEIKHFRFNVRGQKPKVASEEQI